MIRNAVALIFIIVMVLIGIFGWISLFQEQRACHDRGGAYVKGLLGYECVGGR